MRQHFQLAGAADSVPAEALALSSGHDALLKTRINLKKRGLLKI